MPPVFENVQFDYYFCLVKILNKSEWPLRFSKISWAENLSMPPVPVCVRYSSNSVHTKFQPKPPSQSWKYSKQFSGSYMPTWLYFQDCEGTTGWFWLKLGMDTVWAISHPILNWFSWIFFSLEGEILNCLKMSGYSLNWTAAILALFIESEISSKLCCWSSHSDIFLGQSSKGRLWGQSWLCNKISATINELYGCSLVDLLIQFSSFAHASTNFNQKSPCFRLCKLSSYFVIQQVELLWPSFAPSAWSPGLFTIVDWLPLATANSSKPLLMLL